MEPFGGKTVLTYEYNEIFQTFKKSLKTKNLLPCSFKTLSSQNQFRVKVNGKKTSKIPFNHF